MGEVPPQFALDREGLLGIVLDHDHPALREPALPLREEPLQTGLPDRREHHGRLDCWEITHSVLDRVRRAPQARPRTARSHRCAPAPPPPTGRRTPAARARTNCPWRRSEAPARAAPAHPGE